MTDDELKRFLLCKTDCVEWAGATIEAASRWTVQRDVEDIQQDGYREGYRDGQEDATCDD